MITGLLLGLITSVMAALSLAAIFPPPEKYEQFPLDRFLKTQHRRDVRQRK